MPTRQTSVPQPFDPQRIIDALGRHDVRYVLIGAVAARLQGFPRLTADADITPARDPDNIKRLVRVLRELDARIFVDAIPAGLPFDFDAKSLARGELWNLTTNAGRLDLVFRPLGTDGYEDLVRDAVSFRIRDSTVHAASLADIVRCKRASDRVQDRADILVLEAMLHRARVG